MMTLLGFDSFELVTMLLKSRYDRKGTRRTVRKLVPAVRSLC
jgi:hypothetical protein